MKQWTWLVVAVFTLGSFGLVGCDEEEAIEDETTDEVSDELEDESEDDDVDEQEGDETAEMPDEPIIGEPAPDFTLEDEEGNTHSLSDYRGETVVLEWFNIPCPYVARHYEEGTFDNLIDEFEDDHDLTWLAVDTTFDNTPEDTLEWKEETQDIRSHDYPVLQDPEGDVGRLYEARTTPHMFVIDEEGILQYMGGIDDDPRGDEDAEDRERYVEQALAAMSEGESVEPSEAEPYGCTVKYDEDS